MSRKYSCFFLVIYFVCNSAFAEPSVTELRVCEAVYKACTEQQQSGKVKSSCLSYENENPEVMKYLKMINDGLLTLTIGIQSTPWELALFGCNLQHGQFKTFEKLADAPDSAFKSGVNDNKYIIIEQFDKFITRNENPKTYTWKILVRHD